MKFKTQTGKAPRDSAMWQDKISETYFPLDTEFRNEAEFAGDLRSWSLGSIGVSRMTCDAVLYRRHRRHFLNEQDSTLLVTIPELNEVNFQQASRQTKCAPGGFLVERGDAPYEFWHGKPNALWVLKVPSASVRSRIGPTDRLGALSFDATGGVAGLFLDTVKTTVARIEQIDENARDVLGLHILDLLCLSIRSDERVLNSNTSSIRAAHLHRAEQFIRDNLKSDDLSPQLVADSCGISLRYLQRLFAEDSKSINGFIREKRLNRCHEELQAGSNADSVAEIAYRWGFSDQSQFCKHYKAKFGLTPTATRKGALRT
jgi:AraC-like DNA-binding protein